MTLHSIVGSSLCDLCGEKLMDEKVRDGEDTIARSPRRPLPRISQRSAGRRGNCPLRVDGQRPRLKDNAVRIAIRGSRIATTSANKPLFGRARHEWLFQLQFAQSRVPQLDLAPTLAVFASRSVISTPPRFARDHSARATLAVVVETHRLRTSDAAHDEEVCRRPCRGEMLYGTHV